VARDGREAIGLVDQGSGPVDLVVTDVVMPGMSGPALAEELAVRVPRLRVLFVSGYSHEATAERGVPETGLGFLAKPFTASALLERVRQLLDGG
jgi:DNA-binding NarL/FixJ family response regulator